VTEERTATRRPGVEASVRTAAVWAVLSQHAHRHAAALGRPLLVLDLGGGSGGFAVPLAQAGHEVTVVDPSPDALASLRRRADEVGASARIRAAQGDADALATLLGGSSVDLVTCHGTLEHVDDPAATLARLADALAPGGLLSLVVAQRHAAVLARVLAGSIDRAAAALTSPEGRWGEDDPLPRRFDRDALVALVEDTGLRVLEAHGVRIFTELAPSSALDSESDRQALLALEEVAAAHPALAALGAALHVVAERA
jgi:SAM-dependent methyltransferase